MDLQADLKWTVTVGDEAVPHAVPGLPSCLTHWQQLEELLSSVEKRPGVQACLSATPATATTTSATSSSLPRAAAKAVKAATRKGRVSEELKLAFLEEQLELVGSSDSGRRYGEHTLAFAMAVHTSSRSAYQRLRRMDMLHLPSHSTLLSLQNRISGETKSYLKTRIGQLSEMEKTIMLLHDEVSSPPLLGVLPSPTPLIWR